MADYKDVPELRIYRQDKQTCLGVVGDVIDFTEDIRFNACSEISFTVPEKYYDVHAEEWRESPVYGSIEKHRLVYVNDNTDYFEYPVRSIGDSSFYGYNSTIVARIPSNTLSFNQNQSLRNFSVQPETVLFDIGSGGGYAFQHFAQIEVTDGGLRDYSFYHWGTEAAPYNPKLACSAYIPVKPTDVIAIRNAGSDTPTVTPATFQWHVDAYTADDANAQSYSGRWTLYGKGDARLNVADRLPNGGYVRFSYECDPSACYYTYDTTTHQGSCLWTYPERGYAVVFSGERRCVSINNYNRTGSVHSKLHWFVITAVDEDDDGVRRLKRVTAMSYEHTLSNTTFSLSGDTLPFFIPPAITDLVTSNNAWVRDKVGDDTWWSPQSMRRGVLNEILDYLPNWSIGHVSQELMATYRTLDDADDINIYSYLMDVLQSTYHCFIVFDSDQMTISAYSQNDIANMRDRIYLSWDNAIKHFEKKNMDAAYFTALRVRAGDETYGLGLVNPTGNSMVYDFDRISDDLSYIPAGTSSSSPRTLRQAVVAWQHEYSAQLSSTSTYQTTSKLWVAAHMDMVKAQSAKDIALANYHAKADEINTLLLEDLADEGVSKAQYASWYIKDNPMTVSKIIDADAGSTQVAKTRQFHNSTLQQQLADLSRAYYQALAEYTDKRVLVDRYAGTLRSIGKKLTLDYNLALSLNNGDADAHSDSTTILSANEIKELRKYIVEGTWNYENATYSETYNASDIYTTLKEVLDEARSDLADRLSIANFDFSIDSANVLAIDDFDAKAKGMHLGHLPTLHISESEVLTPMLLEVHRNYKDPNDFSFTFTTDMKRRPLKMRFADLYGSITKTSVTDSTFTFDT